MALDHPWLAPLEAITTETLQERLQINERTTQPGMVAAGLGPITVVWKAVLDTDSRLDEWTSREEEPELYAAIERGDASYVGLIAELYVQGLPMADASLWGIWGDDSTPSQRRESYAYMRQTLLELTDEAASDLLRKLGDVIGSLSTAARIAQGLEAPYHSTIAA